MGVSARLLGGGLGRWPEQNKTTDGSICCHCSEQHGCPLRAGSVGMQGSRPGPSHRSCVSLGRESTDSQRGNPAGMSARCSEELPECWAFGQGLEERPRLGLSCGTDVGKPGACVGGSTVQTNRRGSCQGLERKTAPAPDAMQD